MPKYWVKNYFAHGSFPKVGQKQKTEKKEKRRGGLNDGDNNGQATHGARKHAWRTQAAWAKIKKPLTSIGSKIMLWLVRITHMGHPYFGVLVEDKEN